VNATDDLARASSMERSFWVNDTLGFVSVSPRSARARRGVVAHFQLTHPAKVVGSIRTARGALVRRLGPHNLTAGTRTIRWNGRYRSGRLAYPGAYVFDVFAQNAYGPVDVAKPFNLRR
jgi:FlgD Ig-like domain